MLNAIDGNVEHPGDSHFVEDRLRDVKVVAVAVVKCDHDWPLRQSLITPKEAQNLLQRHRSEMVRDNFHLPLEHFRRMDDSAQLIQVCSSWIVLHRVVHDDCGPASSHSRSEPHRATTDQCLFECLFEHEGSRSGYRELYDRLLRT